MSSMADRPEQPAPRLARLDLHGFKSFASRTVFVFEPGITAIVGPNGSGKSNIADAVRWVLGETSHNALRSKRTEDVVFAGGSGRSPAGMAEVTVTFNNEEGWLPSDFTEVAVTRRAFRGGENQYFINGRRVRLKDVAQLTASLGQSYTVVGQGLVDVALSQRADERRGLFEHAADLAGLRLKVAEAERNLNEADANTDRLRDLLTELEPRLKSLERAAKQAQEWQGLRDRQTFLQRGHYRRLTIAAREKLATVERAIAGDVVALGDLQDVLDAAIAARATAKEQHATARDSLANHDSRLDSVREELRRVSHERDLVVERREAVDRRRGDIRDTQTALDDQVSGVELELRRVNAGLLGIVSEVEATGDAVAELRSASLDGGRSRTALEETIAALAVAIRQHERISGDLLQRRSLIEHQRETGDADAKRIALEANERADRIDGLAAELGAFEREDERISASIAELESRLAGIAAGATTQREAIASTEAALTEAERRLGQAANRLSVLRRVRDEGTGLHGGVRRVMQGVRDGSLDGIRGTVAELFVVDAAYDTAIEVALGGRLQDVVVEHWRDAEAAIAVLKESGAGRATFQPLDTLGRRAAQPIPRELKEMTEVHGIAADLVQCDPEIAVVARALLGRVVVVDDLAAAWRVVGEASSGWSAVTLGGEIVRSGGSVTGGSAVRESGVLGRERDLRELPSEIEVLERHRNETRSHQGVLTAANQELAEERGQIETERARLIAQREAGASQHERLAGWLGELGNQQVADATRIAAAGRDRAQQAGELRSVEHERSCLAALLAEGRRQHNAALAELSQVRHAASEGDAALGVAQQELAALEERLRAEQRRVTSLTVQRDGLTEEMTHRAERAAVLDGERSALAGQLERLDREVTSLDDSLTTAVETRSPLRQAMTVTERTIGDLETRIERSRQELLERERAMNQGRLAVERARSELATIHQRIVDDLGLDDPNDLLDVADGDHRQGETVGEWVLSEDVEAVEKEIGRLRDRLRRVGYVGDDVVAEFDRESRHIVHLKTQLQDVMQAALSIRMMLADLNETMRSRFEETFEKVSQAFTEAFTMLFGGGTARLVLTSSEDPGAQGGIDIVAQPPGKRLTTLGLLSGGERALTAVALLFAILRVNPAPFVLLDEVDAALDEVNVVRFRDELRKLASQTQAIVITHNRGTVEIADTLYGVTMGGDGVSQVLSLRLGDLPLDEDVDVQDLAAMSAGVPVR